MRGLTPTFVNAAAVFFGSILGAFLNRSVSERFQRILFLSVGLSTLGIGVRMVIDANNFLTVLFSMVFGGLVGEGIDIERRLQRLGDRIREGDFSTGFIVSSLLFLVGPMTVVGSITAGLKGDGELIYTKSVLDFVSSIVLSSVYGLGVALSAASVLVVQGALTIFAGSLSFLTEPNFLRDLVATGGLLVLGIGLKILELKDTKVANFLPSLVLNPVFVLVFGILGK